jgi:hypothetical protein
VKGCSVEGCEGKYLAKGLCRKHYLQKDKAENAEKWRGYQAKYDERHPGRRAEHARARYAKNPKAHIDYVRKSIVKKKYGLTLQEYEAIIARGCAICGKIAPSGPGGMALDHCHVSGKVRDALCTNCNQGLGQFFDNPERLRAAAAYLEAHA